MPLGHKPGHLPVEESHQQRPNMRTINIGIAHHHDFAVSPFSRIFFLADSTADSSDNVTNFLITQNTVESCAFHVQNLTAQRKNCLKNSVAASFGRSASRVSLDRKSSLES